MEKPVPQGIIEFTNQSDKDLHQGAADALKQAGHNVAPASLNPNDETPLQGIQRKLGDVVHVAGITYGENIGPEVNYGREVTGKSWMSRMREKLNLKGSQSKKAA